MLAYSNFRDIPSPLKIEKEALTEERAELFSAFPHKELLTFTVTIDRAFLTENVFLRFRSDDDGSITDIALARVEEDIPTAHDRFRATVTAAALCGEQEDGLFFYHLVADTVYGRLYSHGEDISPFAWFTDDEGYASPYQLLIYQDAYSTPTFLKKGVMYQIFVDRFCRGGDAAPRKDVEMAASWDAEITQYPAYPGAPLKNNLFYGGDLDGVREKLPYLRSLGVTVLYLCPIFEAYSNHKYDTADYMKIDEMFGGRSAFDRLLAAAKDSGMHVLLDGVFNHTGSVSRYFNADGRYDSVGAYQSTDSPYYPWYRFYNFPDEYLCWWGVKILPTVNSADPSYIRFIAGEDGVVDTYMQAGASGFRLDVADELNVKLLRDIRRQIKKRSQETAVIGEVWEDASNKIAYDKRRHYFRGNELDSVMNYPLKNAIVQYLLHGDADEFSRVTRTLYAHYPRFVSESLMNLLGTHDTERILTVLGGRDLSHLTFEELKSVRLTPAEREIAEQRLRLAWVILSVMPGIPCIYYGDEAGMEGARDPFNRRTYPWGREDEALLAFYRQTGAVRAAAADVLTHGYYRVQAANGPLLAIEREEKCAGRLLLVANSGEESITYPIPSVYRDLYSDETVTGNLYLPPLSFRLLRLVSE
ncbi:MAG: glycoside hydrolase family 13 protein [Clostridia bacterium]|nr:glycoside hydrolase family 13 protein [Clostridia bacterium]